MATPPPPKPLLIYDGDCGFCVYWVRYWQKLTRDRVDYEPFQQAAPRYPDIPEAEFRRAVQYVGTDGKIARAAEASLLTLNHADGGSFWLKLYRRIPGFSFIAEAIYALIASHRPFFYWVSRLLWGKDYAPPQFALVSWLFLRGLGLIYLFAFVSFGVQAMGLIGSQGIQPLPRLVDGLGPQLGALRYWVMPMVFWWADSDLAIRAVCWGGALSSLLLIFNLLPRTNLVVLYFLYLSVLNGGQSFMTYQWDIFLVETGFLGLILACATRPGLWLLRWLIFRFMFMSGSVKLLSGDPTWHDLSALSYHFLTQPLPTPLAWYAAQLPPNALVFATGGTFFIELFLPFLIFFPRRLRFCAAFGMLLLELCIFLTGNYNFFNLQTMLLCLPLFDDAAVASILPRKICDALTPRVAERRSWLPGRILIYLTAFIIVFCSFIEMEVDFGHKPAKLFYIADKVVMPLHIVNTYGLFAVMTTRREEIVIEGSSDGTTWKEYEFRYKPGDVMRAPKWNIPHQPRLDWQMWFAALTSAQHAPWFSRFLEKILQGSPPVLDLMETNPFPDKPPRYVRALIYDYTYAGPDDKEMGVWWNRQLMGTYFPPVSLSHRPHQP